MSFPLIIWSGRAGNWSETPVPLSKQLIPVDTSGVRVPPVKCNNYVGTRKACFCSALALRCLRGELLEWKSYVCWGTDFSPCSFGKVLGGFHCWLQAVGRDIYLWYEHESWVLSLSSRTEITQEPFRNVFSCVVCGLVVFLDETWNERMLNIPLFPFSAHCLQLQLDQ